MVNEILRSIRKLNRSQPVPAILIIRFASNVLASHQFEYRVSEFPRRFLRRIVADPRKEMALVRPGKERRVLF